MAIEGDPWGQYQASGTGIIQAIMALRPTETSGGRRERALDMTISSEARGLWESQPDLIKAMGYRDLRSFNDAAKAQDGKGLTTLVRQFGENGSMWSLLADAAEEVHHGQQDPSSSDPFAEMPRTAQGVIDHWQYKLLEEATEATKKTPQQIAQGRAVDPDADSDDPASLWTGQGTGRMGNAPTTANQRLARTATSSFQTAGQPGGYAPFLSYYNRAGNWGVPRGRSRLAMRALAKNEDVRGMIELYLRIPKTDHDDGDQASDYSNEVGDALNRIRNFGTSIGNNGFKGARSAVAKSTRSAGRDIFGKRFNTDPFSSNDWTTVHANRDDLLASQIGRSGSGAPVTPGKPGKASPGVTSASRIQTLMNRGLGLGRTPRGPLGPSAPAPGQTSPAQGNNAITRAIAQGQTQLQAGANLLTPQDIASIAATHGGGIAGQLEALQRVLTNPHLSTAQRTERVTQGVNAILTDADLQLGLSGIVPGTIPLVDGLLNIMRGHSPSSITEGPRITWGDEFADDIIDVETDEFALSGLPQPEHEVGRQGEPRRIRESRLRPGKTVNEPYVGGGFGQDARGPLRSFWTPGSQPEHTGTYPQPAPITQPASPQRTFTHEQAPADMGWLFNQ